MRARTRVCSVGFTVWSAPDTGTIMLIYGLLVVLVMVAATVAMIGSGRTEPRPLPVVFIIAALTLVVGLRAGVGTDTGYYALWYSRFLPLEQITNGRDPGFTALGKAVLLIFGEDPMWLFLVAGGLTCVLVVWTLRDHARPFALGAALYITTGAYFFAFNGVRQALACAVLFSGTRFLLARRWKEFLPFVLVAALFHGSALVFLLIYLVVTAQGSKARVLAILGLGGTFAAYEAIVEGISSVVGPGRFGDYTQVVLSEGQGVHFLRVLVRLVVFGVAFARRKELERLIPGGGAILVNLALISALLYALAARHWIYARVAVYPSMYEMVLLPALVRTFSGQTRGIFAAGVFLSFLTYIVIVILGGDSDLLPYRSVLG